MVLEDPELGQLAWHVGLASRYAATDQVDLARTETLLAWAILAAGDAVGVDEMTTFEAPVDLGDPSAGSGRLIEALEAARDSALALLGHFTSEQRFDLVDVYERVVAVIESVVVRLGGGERAERWETE